MIYLYLWLALATNTSTTHMGWVYSGTFSNPTACSTAVRSLGVELSKARCISIAYGDNVLQ